MAATTLKVFSPYDGHLIKELPLTSPAEAEDMLAQAHTLFLDRSKWLPEFREAACR
jgi:acyl-CoA reductase-like NAD-dependent aldehyde dehydrogenase